ncbi:MAG: DUF4142 domain-containing protein [Rufibacter sp.]
MKRSLIVLLFGGMAVLLSGCGGSSDSTSVDAAGKHNENLLESTGKDEAAGWFVAESGSSSLLQIELGRLASSKATDPRVQQYGQLMQNHHTQTNAQLKQIADLKNLLLPTQLGEDHQELYNEIMSQSGAEFDKAYLKAMVDSHEESIARYEEMANEGKDPELKSYAVKALPTLRAHLAQAEQLESEVEK